MSSKTTSTIYVNSNRSSDRQKRETTMDSNLSTSPSERDDFSSISSITTLTMTEESSQISARSVSVELLHDNNEMGSENETTLVGEIMSKLTEIQNEVCKATSVKVEAIRLKVNSFREIVKHSTSSFENQQLDNLKNDVRTLRKDNEELKRLSEKQQILVEANDTLNEYITQSDQLRLKEVASLKAKLTLSKMQKELEEEQHDKTSSDNDLINGSVVITPKKKRRKSLLFWRKTSSKTSSPLLATYSPSTSSPANNTRQEENEKLMNTTFENEMEKKCYEIEELAGSKDVMEKQVRELESEMEKKIIEMEKKEIETANIKIEAKQLAKINKSLNRENERTNKRIDKSCDILREINHVTSLTANEIKDVENNIIDNRYASREHYKNLQQLSLNLQTLSEENNILLKRITRKNYDLDVYKLHNERYKMFILKNVVGGDIQKFTDYSVEEILEIANKKLIRKSPNKSYCDKGTLTIADKEGSKKYAKEDANTKDSLDQDGSGDSGVELRNEPTLTSQIFNHPNKPTIKEQHGDEDFLEQIIAYVEYMKNNEINSYVQDLSVLEEENVHLRTSLHASTKNMQRLQNELEYTKHILARNQRDTKPARYNLASELTPRNSTRSNQKLSPRRKTHEYRVSDDEDPSDAITPENNLFLHSYEKGSALIRDIIQEKNQLQSKISQSRQLLQNRKKSLK